MTVLTADMALRRSSGRVSRYSLTVAGAFGIADYTDVVDQDTEVHAKDLDREERFDWPKPPPMDPGIREELETFVERRKGEGGAPTDF